MIGIGVGYVWTCLDMFQPWDGYPAVGDECVSSSKATEAQRCCWFDGTAMTDDSLAGIVSVSKATYSKKAVGWVQCGNCSKRATFVILIPIPKCEML